MLSDKLHFENTVIVPHSAQIYPKMVIFSLQMLHIIGVSFDLYFQQIFGTNSANI